MGNNIFRFFLITFFRNIRANADKTILCSNIMPLTAFRVSYHAKLEYFCNAIGALFLKKVVQKGLKNRFLCVYRVYDRQRKTYRGAVQATLQCDASAGLPAVARR